MEIKYNRAEHSFQILDENSLTVGDIKYKFLDKSDSIDFENDNPEDYTFSYCYKANLKEAKDYTFIINSKETGDNQRIGWIIPISLLITDDETILSNKHLSYYIFQAYQFLLKESDSFMDVNSFEMFSEVISRENFKDVCLLITNNKHISNSEIIKLELPLAMYGYYFHDIKHFNKKRKDVENNKISINLTASLVDNTGKYIDSYINELLSNYLSENESIIRFLYLYQVIEVLMNRLLIKKLEELIVELKGPIGSIKEIDEVLKSKSEIIRWEEIEGMSKVTGNDYTELDNICNNFIRRTKNKFNHPNSIYKVRNHITHRFRVAVQNQNDIMKINDLFEMYLYDIMTGYKE